MTPRAATIVLLISSWAISAHLRAQPECETPNMMIVLDRSGSMADPHTSPKWTAAKVAIKYILDNYGPLLRFGLDYFPSQSDCGTGNVQVGIADDNEQQIKTTLDSTSPSGSTPMAATLMVLNQYRPLKDLNRRNFALLVTDGIDTCAADGDNDPVSAASDLYTNGIRTYVIGFGSGVDADVLRRIAQAGHTGNYYQADDQTQLQQAMNDIIEASLQEVCDQRDNDCDGQVDEEWPDKGSICTATMGLCEAQGVWVCNATGDGLECDAQFHPSAEVCDGRDNNCDGVVDDGFPDADGDGYNTCTDCCDSGNETMTGCSSSTRPQIHPGATELCNGYDDDCDGVIDESDPQLGQICGTTDEGACQFGSWMCLDGELKCVGAIDPGPEVCDGQDNDCDGVPDSAEIWPAEICDDGIDNDCDGMIDSWDPDCGGICQPGQQETCGSAEGDCEQGVRTCSEEGVWGPCENEIGPSPEVCDGRDNDCDGQTDEDALPEVCDDNIDNDCDGLVDGLDPDCGECEPGESRTCGIDEGECQSGQQICTQQGHWSGCDGAIEPTDESCDARDNDCDGLTDEGDLCSGNEACLCGTCSPPCSSGECPAGQWRCVNDWCLLDPCCGVQCPAGRECGPNGSCLDRCEEDQLQCAADQDCRLGMCVPADCLTEGHECEPDQRCMGGDCLPDPCYRIECAADEYCREGVCAPIACSDCTDSQLCVLGQCRDSLCAGVECPPGQVCQEGICAADPCQSVYCPQGTTCISGECRDDPCLNLDCPTGSQCSGGFCIDLGSDNPPDAGTADGDEADGTGIDAGTGSDESPGTDENPVDGGIPGDSDSSDDGGGCGCGFGAHPTSTAWIGLWIGLQTYFSRRRFSSSRKPSGVKNR